MRAGNPEAWQDLRDLMVKSNVWTLASTTEETA
jgi:hypothetical protein